MYIVQQPIFFSSHAFDQQKGYDNRSRLVLGVMPYFRRINQKAMLLPEDERLDIAKLASVFSDTTNSYKFYWMLAILDSLRDNGQARIAMGDLSNRMIASVWYPLN